MKTMLQNLTAEPKQTYFFCSRIRMGVLIRYLRQNPAAQYRVVQYDSFERELPPDVYEQSKTLQIPLSQTGDRLDRKPCCLISHYSIKRLQKYLDDIFKSDEYRIYEESLSADMLAEYNRNFSQDAGCIPVSKLT